MPTSWRVRKTMEIESIKSAIISRVKEISRLEEEKKVYLKDIRESVKALKEEIEKLTVELEDSEREELNKEADEILSQG
jgi:vacuolar-type H+-ATPase subunit H